MRRRIELHIEELVLEGVSRHDRHRVAAAVRRELAQQVLAGGLPAGVAGLSGRDLVVRRPVSLPVRTGPDAVGRAVAGGVYRALDGGAS